MERWVPTVRKADHGDARELANLAEATFRATFAAANTAEHMDLHCRNSYGEQVQAGEISSPGVVTFVSEAERRLVGYAQLRWAETPGCVTAKAPGEIQRLYVVDGWHGKGVAQELMDTCINEMRQHGSDVIWLGVWERNARAISFYKKWGFEEVGEHTFTLGGDPQRDLVMARAVVQESSIDYSSR